MLGGLGRGAGAAEYSRQAMLSGPVTVKDNAAAEVPLAAPVSRRQEMAQLDIVFSTDAAGKYSFSRGGISSPRGAVNLVVTLVADDGAKYVADIVTGDFYANGVLARFAVLPPRRVALRKMLLRGLNVPPIRQIYWVEGRERRSTGVDETLTHCEEGKCRWNEAMDYCRSRGGRLLSLAELKAMFADQCAAGGEDCREGFWSSTEYAPFPRKAWYLDFSDGKGVAAEKIYNAHVRCMVPASAAYTARDERKGECAADKDCRLIYSNCGCAAVPAGDPRTVLDGGAAVCKWNICHGQNTAAVCRRGRCVKDKE
ncbi:MAG: hypothetical protein A2X32_08905 [Elusimicrobia bacterium GWC2_64_44]|nr:MAG: hypothetical protein A2X32_08905 [Elusimicrobia bacterium GWC2_64_44]